MPLGGKTDEIRNYYIHEIIKMNLDFEIVYKAVDILLELPCDQGSQSAQYIYKKMQETKTKRGAERVLLEFINSSK